MLGPVAASRRRVTYVRAVTSYASATSTSASIQSDGTTRMLVCLVQHYGANADTNSITFNGSENFTKIATVNFYDSTGRCEVWVLKNPSVTTANVVATRTGSGPIAIGVMLFNGATTASVTSTVAHLNGSTTNNSSLTLSTTVNDFVVDCLAGNTSATTWTPNAGQTQRTSTNYFRTSTKPGAAGTTNVGWTNSNEPNSQVAIVISP